MKEQTPAPYSPTCLPPHCLPPTLTSLASPLPVLVPAPPARLCSQHTLLPASPTPLPTFTFYCCSEPPGQPAATQTWLGLASAQLSQREVAVAPGQARSGLEQKVRGKGAFGIGKQEMGGRLPLTMLPSTHLISK